ncbi:MAG: flavodoxin family protein [Patescibacteria group bacterium]
MAKRISDKELMSSLGIDLKTLRRFQEIQRQGMKDAKNLVKKRKARIKVLGVSGSAREEFDMAQENSNSEELLKQTLNHCRKLGAQTELISLRKYHIEHCRACYSTTNTQCHFYCSCYPKGTKYADDMSNILYDKILEADVLLFATPVNNFKISTLMATFIDRCISLDGSLPPADLKHPKDRELNIKHMKYIEMTADNNVPGSGLLRRFLGKTAGIIITGHEEGAGMVISNLFMTLNNFGMVFPPFSHMYAMASVCQSTHEDKKTVLNPCYAEETLLLAKNIINGAKLARKTDPAAWAYDYRAN